jgi:acyl carrier protein
MATATLESRVIELVAKAIGIDAADVRRDTRFFEDLDADSLDCLEIVMDSEEEFNVSIDDDSWQIETVGELIDLIQRL